MRTRSLRAKSIIVPLFLLLILPGCATLQSVLALRQVDFSLDRVSGLRIAGVEMGRLQRYEDLSAVDVARLVQAVSLGELPLSFLLHVRADNPEGNPEARLLALDWTLFLQDRETVSGGLLEGVVIPASGSADVPLEVRLDLMEYFDGGVRDLVNLALSLAGQEGPPTHVRLMATPTVDTPLGPIRYPQPLTVVNREVGGVR